jgi:hypothetical protein
VSALDPEHFCFRGLEPFQTEEIRKLVSSSRKFHRSMIFEEQLNQQMFGIHDPQRFRALVADQSETALRRAQEQAAMDERELYNNNKAPSLVMPSFENMSRSLEQCSLQSMPLRQIMRDLQKLNTRRRLMEAFEHPEMYSHDSQTARKDMLMVADIVTRNSETRSTAAIAMGKYNDSLSRRNSDSCRSMNTHFDYA